MTYKLLSVHLTSQRRDTVEVLYSLLLILSHLRIVPLQLYNSVHLPYLKITSPSFKAEANV